MVSSGAFAYTKQEDKKLQNFIEDNITDAYNLSFSDVKKALPFMTDAEAKELLLNMQKMLGRHARVTPVLVE